MIVNSLLAGAEAVESASVALTRAVSVPLSTTIYIVDAALPLSSYCKE